MKNQILDSHGLKSLGLQDDLLALRKIHSLPQLTYVDVSKQRIITEITERWTILKELCDMSSKIK
ncbi:cellulose biosynthesis protein BcsR [Legionella sp. WA2022007384]